MLVFNKYSKKLEVVVLSEDSIIVNPLKAGATYIYLSSFSVGAAKCNLFTECKNAYKMIISGL